MIHTQSLVGSNSSCISTQGSDLHGTHRLYGAEMARQSGCRVGGLYQMLRKLPGEKLSHSGRMRRIERIALTYTCYHV